MLVLNLHHSLHQNLLTHFLQSRGLCVIDSKTLPERDWATVVKMTDRVPLFSDAMEHIRQIWLLDDQSTLPNPIPESVKGLLMVDCDLAELETCVRQVLQQQSYVSPTLLNLLTKQPKGLKTNDGHKLTSREKQVFELIKAGMSIRVIADRLFISPHTAENHRADIQRKMALTGRLSLVRYAASV